MACKHGRMKSVNCKLICIDCGAVLGTLEPVKQAEATAATVEPVEGPTTSMSVRKIGFEAEANKKKPAPRRRKKAEV